MRTDIVFLVITAVWHITLARFPFPRVEPVLHKPLRELPEPLILTPLIEDNLIQEAKHLSEVHLDAFQNITSYSGFFTVDKNKGGNLFFWFFPSANNYKHDPVVLWLQGGPGASSLFGLFAEHGPFIVENGSVSLREYSWHKNYSMLYIDQPVGTGWSFTNGSLVSSQEEVAEHLYSALTQFFTMFSELQENEFFVSGESYGGKYVPAIGFAIYKRNPTASIKINLQGLLIGNGWCDPVHQLYYGDVLHQMGLADPQLLESFYEAQNYTLDNINLGRYVDASGGWSTMLEFLYYGVTGLGNIFNFLKDSDDSPTDYQYFINEDDVREALHVGNKNFDDQSYDAFAALYADITKTVQPWIVQLLQNYRMLFYNGQLDVIVAYALTANFLKNIPLKWIPRYDVAERQIWTVGDRVAGYVKTSANLTEVLVRDAGHLVPMDQPEFAFDLISKFIANKPITGNSIV